MADAVTRLDTVPDMQRHGPLAELWGDTLDLNHLGKSVVIGGTVSLACFLLADRLLLGIAPTPQLARTYAMLAGLVGCLIGGAICARLFAPKRTLIEQSANPAWREEAMTELVLETGWTGSALDLSAPVARELRELGLYELFAQGLSGDAAGDPKPIPRPGA